MTGEPSREQAATKGRLHACPIAGIERPWTDEADGGGLAARVYGELDRQLEARRDAPRDRLQEMVGGAKLGLHLFVECLATGARGGPLAVVLCRLDLTGREERDRARPIGRCPGGWQSRPAAITRREQQQNQKRPPFPHPRPLPPMIPRSRTGRPWLYLPGIGVGSVACARGGEVEPSRHAVAPPPGGSGRHAGVLHAALLGCGCDTPSRAAGGHAGSPVPARGADLPGGGRGDAARLALPGERASARRDRLPARHLRQPPVGLGPRLPDEGEGLRHHRLRCARARPIRGRRLHLRVLREAGPPPCDRHSRRKAGSSCSGSPSAPRSASRRRPATRGSSAW